MEIVTVLFDQFFPFFVMGNLKKNYGKSMEMYGHVLNCMEKTMEKCGNL